jgi:hypothetical protein
MGIFGFCRARASIVDLFGRQLLDTGTTLLEALIEIGLQEELFCLEGCGTELSELSVLFRRAGFRPRETCARVVAYEKPHSDQVFHPSLRWTFSHAEALLHEQTPATQV